jgi:hypothetical protein
MIQSELLDGDYRLPRADQRWTLRLSRRFATVRTAAASTRNQAHLNQKSTARQSFSTRHWAFSGAILEPRNGLAV